MSLESLILDIVRCPRLSDGAKVTLLELRHHFGKGHTPSLSELQRLRGHKSKVTAQNHLQELIRLRLIKKTRTGPNNRVQYSINENGLKQLQTASQARTALSEREMIALFHELGAKQVPGIRPLKSDRGFIIRSRKYFDWPMLEQMIRFFWAHYKRLRIQPTLKDFAQNIMKIEKEYKKPLAK